MPAIALTWRHGKGVEKIMLKEGKKFPVCYHLHQNMVLDVGDRAREMELFYSLCVPKNLCLP